MHGQFSNGQHTLKDNACSDQWKSTGEKGGMSIENTLGKDQRHTVRELPEIDGVSFVIVYNILTKEMNIPKEK